MHITQTLSEFVYELKYEDLPYEVVLTTQKYILDYYAACFAGMKVNKNFNEAVLDVVLDMGGKQECDFILSDRRIPCANAAFLSACYAHGADMDDGNSKAMGHIGAHVISTVMTLAQVLHSDGKQVVTAINVGYDIYNRIAAALQPGLVRRGFHSTGTVGAIACGAACAKLMGMDVQGIYYTMALCAIQASGLILIAESGQCCKPINPANAAKTGIMSARIIEKGIESSWYPLESSKGFFHAMSDEVDEEILLKDLGKTFTICESYMKPYPSCRHTHCGIDCVLALREKIAAIDEIESIKVYIYGNAIRIAGQIIEPKTSDDTKFSIHYSMAAALVRGHFNLSDLDISGVEQLRPLIGKIELIEDESMEDRSCGVRGCRTVIRMSDGTEYEEMVRIPYGDATNPMGIEDLCKKLNDCADGILSQQQQDVLVKNILGIEQMHKIDTINLYK
ncbi:MAG: MmgE/PrpD family protein [Lachnospiraceae bacterium]|nr:MmgE/PrpD family protein [Lachnospiraceae bacterium]